MSNLFHLLEENLRFRSIISIFSCWLSALVPLPFSAKVLLLLLVFIRGSGRLQCLNEILVHVKASANALQSFASVSQIIITQLQHDIILSMSFEYCLTFYGRVKLHSTSLKKSEPWELGLLVVSC